MAWPSIDEIVTNVPPPRPEALAWIRAHLAGRAERLEPASLLDFGYDVAIGSLDDPDVESLLAWFEAARSWGLARALAGMDDRGLAWCAAAVRLAWTWWKPALAASSEHRADAVDRLVTTATDDALRTYAALPSHRSPPPYAGHFYGALHGLLEARQSAGDARAKHVSESLQFACVAPDGSRRAREIAALRR